MDIFADKPRKNGWPGFQHVIFDCDSTLSVIEGIDELSSEKDHQSEISRLTSAAMDGECALEDVYHRRLDLLNPTRAQVVELTEKYKHNMVADAELVVHTLLENGISVYIVSGGLEEPVQRFGAALGVPLKNIRAVPVLYDELSGEWWRQGDATGRNDQNYYKTGTSYLTGSEGKQGEIASLLEGKTGSSMLVGDGVSDLSAAQAVDLFVGFGGVVVREKVKNDARVFVDAPTLLPILALAMNGEVLRSLEPGLIRKIKLSCQRNCISFRSKKLQQNFYSGLSMQS